MNDPRKSIHPALLSAHTPEEAARLLIRATGGAFVVTLNLELIARAVASPAFARLIRKADALVCDGIGGGLLLRMDSPKFDVPRIPGIDLGFALLRESARQGGSIFFLGGSDGVAKQAADKLKAAIPGLQIAGFAHGYFERADLPALRGMIRRSGATVVVVCTGSPRQEEWILQNRRYLPGVRLFLPLGGSLDVWAGRALRAPIFWQRIGAEWLWRLLREPARAGRLAEAILNLRAFRRSKYGKITDILFQIE